MDNKILIGGAVAVVAAYFIFRKKPEAQKPVSGLGIVPEALMRMNIRDRVISSGTASQLSMHMNGSSNSVSSLIAQIRAREIQSGSV
jgi:hypothetical protein